MNLRPRLTTVANVLATLALLAAIVSCLTRAPLKPPPTAESRWAQAHAAYTAAASPEERFVALTELAKQSFETRRFDEAERHARELLSLAGTLPRNWNHGNAIHDGHMVLGRLAARAGQDAAAEAHLAQAGDTPGSPQLDTYGPNMSLAEDLLARDRREAVLDYFERCRRFWKMHDGRLDDWSQQVRAGETPAFGNNLRY